MQELIDNDGIKKAFRTAYDVMSQHNKVLTTPDEYVSLSDKLTTISHLCDHDMLTCRLIMAVYEFICDKSKKIIDSEGKT